MMSNIAAGNQTQIEALFKESTATPSVGGHGISKRFRMRQE
jgi:hypothetical protein